MWMQRGGGDLCVSPQELNMHDSYIMGTRGDIILWIAHLITSNMLECTVRCARNSYIIHRLTDRSRSCFVHFALLFYTYCTLGTNPRRVITQ